MPRQLLHRATQHNSSKEEEKVKKQTLTKLIAAGLASAMVIGTAGCAAPAAAPAASGSSEAQEATAEGEKPFVTLKMYAIADAPNDTELAKEFWDQLNAQLKEDLNINIEYTYAAGNDYKNNYALAIASGEKYDLMMSATGWLDFTQYASKNAFLPLEDLLPENAPYLWENISEEAWDATKVNGHIYGVPNMDMNITACTFVYREDLRKKYDLPEIKSMDDVETYLQGIKDNEPGILPSDDYQCQVYGTSWIYQTPYIGIDEIHDRIFNFVYDPRDGEVKSVIETPEYKDYMVKMKDWADRGFWPADVLASTNWGVMQVLSGAAASSFNEQLPGYNYHATQVATEHADEGWELGFYMYFEGNPDASLTYSATNNMFSIAASAEHPDRALEFIDYVQQHEDLWDYITYGIEGKNYEKTEDGRIDVSNIADGASFNYFPSNLVGNASYKKAKSDSWVNYDEMMEKINGQAKQDLFDGFVLDKSNFETEYTALNDVQNEYGYPLQAGLVTDVDAAYDQYIAAAKAAGLDSVREQVAEQVAAFLADAE